MSEKNEELVQQKIEEHEKSIKSPDEIQLSAWIMANKPLILTSGSITAGTAKAISWIVTNVDEIKHFIDVISPIFKGPMSQQKILDFDCLKIGNENLNEALCYDETLIHMTIKAILKEHNFDRAYSKKNDLFIEK